ncbi:MAG: hypothetical protein HXX16_10160 [Bacteroidales bacterium]|nr:hypothetical protein [Bacteroidales bacterium]
MKSIKHPLFEKTKLATDELQNLNGGNAPEQGTYGSPCATYVTPSSDCFISGDEGNASIMLYSGGC